MNLRFSPYKIGRFCWQMLAVSLLLFALLVSLIRGLLPQLDQARQQVTAYIAQHYGVRVELGQLSAHWQAYGPSLTIEKLVLPKQEHLPITLVVQNVQVKLDFWETLLTAKPQVENVIFDGVKLALDMDQLNAAAADNTSPQRGGNMDWLYSLLLEQLERFSVGDATVQLLSKEIHYRPIHIGDLRWQNHGQSHQGSGALYLDDSQQAQQHLTLRIDLNGDGYQPDTIHGQAYVQAQSLDIGRWASAQQSKQPGLADIPLEGVINLAGWVEFANRSLQSGLVQFSPSWFQWTLDNQQQRFDIAGGSISWQPQQGGWRLDSHNLQLKTNGKSWQPLQLQLQKQQQQFFGQLNQIQVADLMPLLPVVPGVDKVMLQQILAMTPQGSLGPLKLYRGADGDLQAALPVQGLTWKAVGEIPGIAPLDLRLSWRNGYLNADLPSQHYQLEIPKEFKAPLVFDGAAFAAGFDTDTLQLFVADLQVSNEDLQLDTSLRLDLRDQATMALAAAVQLHKADNAGRYFPRRQMGEDLSHYLEQALKAGHSDNAAVVWRGPLANFPFDDHSGIFQAGFTMENGRFAFQPDWPSTKDLTIDGLFENARMEIKVLAGKLQNIDISGANVSIPSLEVHSHLLVDADIAAKGWDIAAVMLNSPLKDSVGATLDTVKIQDSVNGKLKLDIPLYAGGTADIQGQVAFADTPVFIRKPGVKLNKVNGIVSFHNEVVTGEGITALLYGQPATITFDTGNLNDKFAVNVHAKGNWQLSRLPPELDNPLTPFYQGSTAWSGALQLIFDDGGYTLQANVDADLANTELTLPAPFAKDKGEPLALQAELLGDDQQASLGIRIGDKAEFWGGFAADSGNRLQHYDLLLGRLFRSGDQLVKDGGQLRLDLDKVDFAQWLPVITAFTDTKPQAAASTATEPQRVNTAATAEDEQRTTEDATDVAFFPPLKGIQAKINDLTLLGQKFTQLQMTAHPTDQSWQFEGLSPEFSGSVEIFPDWYRQGVKLKASRLYLNPLHPIGSASDIKEAATAQQPDDLPPLAVDVDDFRFQNIALGHLVLQSAPAPKGYHIQTLSVSAPQGKLEGQGDWLSTAGDNQTKVNFNIDSPNFEQLAQLFDVNPGVKDSPLKMKAALQWHGGPVDFNLPTLNGDVHFELGKGHMEQISDKGARIFSLFSLDSLLRKLSLDFSDVFGKGLYFNTFGGDLRIDNGMVKTTNTEMDAIAGNMKVRGYTDLNTESLNYDIRFAPKLASSVPTVVLLSTSAWTMGIGAFALTKVLEPVIEVISEIRFRLTGTMSEPKLEELERKSKEIEIPKSALPASEQPAANDAAGATTKSPAPATSAETKPAASDSAAKTTESSETTATVKSAEATTDAKPAETEKQNGTTPTAPKTSEPTPKPTEEPADAGKSSSVSEQSQARREFGVYQLAA
ncbi:TIGR02099 family protein [Shewanella yunxiaonensis]|uniref:TIGR02099 family protein n=1 Tax=Shewanella yunxiaonensis TaxID=2829809 RepID=A0ABX7YTR0_9GAMM|nr:YhdP family protein [Shewanella yunxiaonensis]QUN05571.1 TIGR02099 family protein [Shewanella yunxiaonensis]